MRAMLIVFEVVLFLIALAGMGSAVAMVVEAISDPRHHEASILAALVAGALPFMIGTIALGALAIVQAVDLARHDQISAINRNTDIALNEARHAEHHRVAR